jgi:hypothetical protein
VSRIRDRIAQVDAERGLAVRPGRDQPVAAAFLIGYLSGKDTAMSDGQGALTVR